MKKNNFNPSESLILFATEFSNKFKELDNGFFMSNDTKFSICYVDKITNIQNGEVSKSIFRLSKYSNQIELSKDYLNSMSFSSDYVFYIILWCGCRSEYNNSILNKDINEMVTDYYILQSGRSCERLINDMFKSF